MIIPVILGTIVSVMCLFSWTHLVATVLEVKEAFGLLRRTGWFIGGMSASASRTSSSWLPSASLLFSRTTLSRDEAASLTYSCCGAGILLALTVWVLIGSMYLGAVVLIMSLLTPRLVISRRRRFLTQTFRRQLPTALASIAAGLSAGLSLSQALEYTGSRLGGAVGNYLVNIARDQKVGASLDEALANLRRHFDVRELDTVVMGLMIQRKSGGNLAELLASMAAVLKQKSALQRKLEVMTAQTRLSGRVIGLLPIGVALVVSVVDPSFFSPMLSTFTGWVFLVAASAAEAAGFYAVGKIATIEI